MNTSAGSRQWLAEGIQALLDERKKVIAAIASLEAQRPRIPLVRTFR